MSWERREEEMRHFVFDEPFLVEIERGEIDAIAIREELADGGLACGAPVQGGDGKPCDRFKRALASHTGHKLLVPLSPHGTRRNLVRTIWCGRGERDAAREREEEEFLEEQHVRLRRESC